jgi:hypothetical protein
MNKVANMSSRPPMQNIVAMGINMQVEPFTHELKSEEYVEDIDFGDYFHQLKKKKK